MLANKNKKRKPRPTIFFPVVLGAAIVALLAFLVISNWQTSRQRTNLNSQIETLQKQIQAAEQEKANLEKGMSQVQTQAYQEEVARNDLGMQKPGEEAVVVEPQTTSTQEAQPVQKNFFQRIWDNIKF